jgi:hypothetical protein
MVLSDGGGWNGEAAAGCPAVVVVGVVGGVVVGGAGGGGDGVAVLAGAAGAVRRAGRGFGASTVTCGIATAGGVPGSACGVSGAGGDGCGAGASGAGVGVGGVSGGAVVAGGVSGGVAGVCDDATPAKQNSTTAELLSRSKRLLRIDITRPTSLTGTTRQPPTINASRRNNAGWGLGPALAGARAVRDQIDVRRWEVRARGTARLVMPSDQIRRRPRAARGRKRWAAATTAFRPAPIRRRDG